MRKLKLQVQMTIDGFIAGPAGEMDWVEWNWGEDIKKYVTQLTDPVDCIVLGRKLAQGFIPHWAGVASNPENSEHLTGIKFTETLKIVFSSTLTDLDPEVSGWKNTHLKDGGLKEEIKKLKHMKGGDIIAYGGAQFVSSLIRSGLIDEYELFINPSAIGNGLTIFGDIDRKIDLKLKKCTAFNCGITALSYVPR